MPGPPDVAEVLASVTAALPGGGEDRPGQLAMAEAVGRAIDEQRHLVVGAGTGTGKSLAYLIPAVLSGRSVVVATATRALQDQLATKDLPLVAEALRARRTVQFAVLKGRSNYLCRQRATEVGGAEEAGLSSMALFEDDATTGGAGAGRAPETIDISRLGGQLRRLIAWAETSATGDRAELEFEPNPRAWAAVSVSARECPGAYKCPSGTICFAEKARERAAAADIVVVNTHLYATHVASDGAVLPEHDIVVLDEAHAVEDVMTEALGVEITPGRLRAVAQGARGLVSADDGRVVDGVAEVADRLDGVLSPLVGRRVLTEGSTDPAPESQELAAVLELAGGRLGALNGALRRASTESTASPGAGDGGEDGAARRNRALLNVGHLGEELSRVIGLGDGQVAWVEAAGPSGRTPTLRVAPIDVGPMLGQRLWPNVTAVLTSATVPPQLETRLGLPSKSTDHLEVGSPFPFETCALLYCAKHLPDPRQPGAREALHVELGSLIAAAGGRTLALFTSWRAMHDAADALRLTLPFEVLAQGDKPKAKLLDAFSSDHASCLFATMSFWQGVDVPGPTLSLVTLDRLPFSRPDDPLLQARRDRAGPAAFRTVDIPRAATLLAQGAGRLIRSSTDKGVVAVLDSRLATANYRHDLLAGLPPMRRTVDHDEVVAFLEGIAREAGDAPGSPSASGSSPKH